MSTKTKQMDSKYGYILVDIDVQDPVVYEKYKALAPSSIKLYGGEYLVRGGEVGVLEGDWNPSRIVLLRFPSVAQAKAWWDSEEYAEAKALRMSASKGNMIVLSGL